MQELIDQGIDSLVLGCTHYPLLRKTIGEVVGDNIILVNPAKETAKDLEKVLQLKNLLKVEDTKSNYQYYVSDIPEKFALLASEFLNIEIDNINNVDIQKY